MLLGGFAAAEFWKPNRDIHCKQLSMSAGSGQVGISKAASHKVGCVNDLPEGLVTTEHFFQVPLDYGNPKGETIEVFCRELRLQKNRDTEDLPALVFLQGGPGFPAGRPVSANSGWMKRALEEYRVFLLDQRGTGRSTAVTHETLAALPSPQAQAEHAGKMRADNIVRDCETIRRTVVGPDTKWAVLGQSFGGFCLLTYLSMAPEGLQYGLFTGGLAPVGDGCTADKVYRKTYLRAAQRSNRFYDRYPQHVDTVRHITSLLDRNPPDLPSGGKLTARRFLQVGLMLGSGSGLESMHYLLENPWKVGAEKTQLSYEFLCKVEACSAFEVSPLYAIAHEAIYCSGPGQASHWSAQRILQEFPLFDIKQTLHTPGQRVMLMGEHCFSWMFDGDYPALASLKEASDLLATRSDWPRLYDLEQLRKCTVPCAAAVYVDDMFVEIDLSLATAETIGSAPGGLPPKVWVTNEYQHSGLRDDGYRIVDKLLGMVRGTVNIPS